MNVGSYMRIGSYMRDNIEGYLPNRPNNPNGLTQDQSTIKADKKANDTIENLKIQQEIQKLKSIEQKVIAHEMAHKIVGGQYAGPMQYKYARGPDNRMYIVGGEVAIDVSEAPTPEETIKKMMQVQRAALAPADPSPQDKAVAIKAAMQLQKARLELLSKQQKEQTVPASNQKTELSIYA